jgi:hypothetical protein
MVCDLPFTRPTTETGVAALGQESGLVVVIIRSSAEHIVRATTEYSETADTTTVSLVKVSDPLCVNPHTMTLRKAN